MTRLIMRRPDDFHRHFRQGRWLNIAAGHVGPFTRGLPMPNTLPAICTGAQAIEYANQIVFATKTWFDAIPCIKLTRATTPDIIRTAHQMGVMAIKFYPEGMTTNAEDGISAAELKERGDCLEAMQETNMLFLAHGEHDKAEYCLDREASFLPVVKDIVSTFPKLKFVLEHITTRTAAEFVSNCPDNVAATITPHHLRITLNEVIGDKLETHNFCKPIAKHPKDREALVKAATSGNPKFFLGTDDAPHPKETKECSKACAGVFTGPYALGHYAEVFEAAGALDKLEDFASRFGAEFYGLPLNEGTIELVKSPHVILPELDGIVPFMTGETLSWRVI